MAANRPERRSVQRGWAVDEPEAGAEAVQAGAEHTQMQTPQVCLADNVNNITTNKSESALQSHKTHLTITVMGLCHVCLNALYNMIQNAGKQATGSFGSHKLCG